VSAWTEWTAVVTSTSIATAVASALTLGVVFGVVGAHANAATELEGDRVRRLEMAARLAHWMHGEAAEAAPDLATAAERFVHDGAFVDAAREAIAHGETVPSLAEAYGQLAIVVDERRRRRDLEFAKALAGWSTIAPTDFSRLVPIEQVLGEAVAPIAKNVPVLFLVLDGLSYPESIRITSDLRAIGWTPQAPKEEANPIVVAALPTVTVISRASLLSGNLIKGGQDVEREGFAEHRALRGAGRKPPRLFHKKDLRTMEGSIAPVVCDAILDIDQRVVGVVVNAVDDHLAKGGQLRLADGLRGIRPLRPLLDAAAEAGRVVVLASDHGHVIEIGSNVRRHAGGERWRVGDPPPGDDEVEIIGQRVLEGDGRIVAPGIDSIRYTTERKRGYHGGATPQEVLCPLLVLTTANTRLPGWSPQPVRQPEWWLAGWRPARYEQAPPPPPKPAVDADGQVELVLEAEPRRAAPSEATVELVLASSVMDYQREMAGRQALDEESLRSFLTVLYSRAGVASAAVLAEPLHLSPSRLRTKLEALRRMLNVDGYPVVTIETDGTVKLNLDLLRAQFEVGP
jgi:hypothetical protein